jgi:hypothetical protein
VRFKDVREGKLGRYWNARKIISEYELMLECTFGKKIVTTQTLKLIIKFDIFDSKKFPLINQLGWSAYKKFPRNVFIVLVMALELIFLLVINECRTIFYLTSSNCRLSSQRGETLHFSNCIVGCLQHTIN